MVPYAFVLINLSLGGDILSEIIGIIVGNIYYYGSEICKLKFGFEIFPTPSYL